MAKANDELPVWKLRKNIEREIAELRIHYADLMPAQAKRPASATASKPAEARRLPAQRRASPDPVPVRNERERDAANPAPVASQPRISAATLGMRLADAVQRTKNDEPAFSD
jgi:hypothetical protein